MLSRIFQENSILFSHVLNSSKNEIYMDRPWMNPLNSWKIGGLLKIEFFWLISTMIGEHVHSL